LVKQWLCQDQLEPIAELDATQAVGRATLALTLTPSSGVVMPEQKTQATSASIEGFLAKVEGDQRQADCRILVQLMSRVTGEPPALWGASIVGFGRYHYKYASGHEGDSCLAGFSPRKTELSIYIIAGFEHYDALMAKLGKHKTGKSCLYVKRLADIDLEVLETLVAFSVAEVKRRYPDSP
jgi:hypothetical protein